MHLHADSQVHERRRQIIGQNDITGKIHTVICMAINYNGQEVDTKLREMKWVYSYAVLRDSITAKCAAASATEIYG